MLRNIRVIVLDLLKNSASTDFFLDFWKLKHWISPVCTKVSSWFKSHDVKACCVNMVDLCCNLWKYKNPRDSEKVLSKDLIMNRRRVIGGHLCSL